MHFETVSEIRDIETINPLFAICVDNAEYPASLELHKIYQVLPDVTIAMDGDLRVVDESGEYYIFPASYFLLLELPRDTEHILEESFARSLQPVT